MVKNSAKGRRGKLNILVIESYFKGGKKFFHFNLMKGKPQDLITFPDQDKSSKIFQISTNQLSMPRTGSIDLLKISSDEEINLACNINMIFSSSDPSGRRET